MFIVEASYSVVFCYSIPSWQVGNIICPMLLGTKWRHRTVEFSVKDHTAKKQGSQPVRLFLEPLPLHTLHKTQTTNVMLFVFTFRNFRRRPTVWSSLQQPALCEIGCTTEGSPHDSILRSCGTGRILPSFSRGDSGWWAELQILFVEN